MKSKNKHPEASTGDIHHDAFNTAQENQRVARRRGTRIQRAGAALGLLTTLGTGAALATHQPKAEVAGIATVGYAAAGVVEIAKKSQKRQEDNAGLTADAAAANRIIAAGLHEERAPLWAREHIRITNFEEARPEDSVSSARTINHGGMVLSSDGNVTPIDTSVPSGVKHAPHPVRTLHQN